MFKVIGTSYIAPSLAKGTGTIKLSGRVLPVRYAQRSGYIYGFVRPIPSQSCHRMPKRPGGSPVRNLRICIIQEHGEPLGAQLHTDTKL